ncbi:MAG: hypothetical protein KIT72_03665 [Polyangiaceae bacterium]|nr:hypothetical protein [Polyangiaceae bacterium]MCW5789499.1 hypothetical protein [Polyangiaceae bacterium]
MNALAIGVDLARTRLGTSAVWVTLGASLLACTLGAWLERGAGGAHLSLLGMTFGLAIPLTALSLSHRVFDGRRLAESFEEPARWGADRRHVLLGALAVLGPMLAGWFALLAAVVVIVAGGDVLDAARSASVGAQAGLIYACGLTAASTWGKRGHGRVGWIALDWAFGASTSALSLPFPRAHLANLLGAAPPLDLSQLTSGALLIALASAALLYAQLRLPR